MVIKYAYNQDNGTLLQLSYTDDRLGSGYLKLQDDIQEVPTVSDRLHLLEFIIQFAVIKPPKTGDMLDEIIPEFKSYEEMERWKRSAIMNGLDRIECR